MNQAARKRIRTILWIALVIALSASGRIVSVQWRLSQAKELEALPFNAFEFKDATFEVALQKVVEEVHKLGHPEVKLTIYPDPGKAPGFHLLASDEPRFPPKGNLDLSVAFDGTKWEETTQASAAHGSEKSTSGPDDPLLKRIRLKQILSRIAIRRGSTSNSGSKLGS
jgi:hypothetical protein